jgi:hypothetical protein
MATGYIEAAAAEKLAVKFVVNNGAAWDETTSRCHCCTVVYRDTRYIEQRITKWALTIDEAYQQARDAWLEEQAAGRAL